MDEGKCTFQLFANRQYDCQKERKKKEFEGTSSQMVIFSKSDRTGVEESEAREWVPKSVSSSEDDGTDDWKPTQDESEGYSEEEEEQERKRIPKMVAASEEDGTHDSRPTQDESKDDSKDEAEHLGQMIHKVAMEKGAFVSSELPQRTEERQQVAVASKSQRHHCVRNGHKCPICGHVYADIVQHLRVTEQVVNKTELTLLSQFSHRHFSTNLDCPVRLCQSKHLKRLDKHLEKVHKLQTPMIKLYMQKAKDRCIAKELALLRVSNPTPQMVSHVGEVDDAVIEEGIFRALEEGSKVASAIASSSKAHSDHATLIHWPAPPSDSEAPSDHATLNHRPAPPSDSEAPSDHATLNHWPAPPSDSEAPSDHDTLNHRPAPPSDSEAHSDHSTLIHRPARDDSVDSDSEAHSDHAILNHRPAPPSDSKALGDSTRPNLQPPLSASDTLSDHTIPIMQPPSISSSKVTCHSTGVSPDVLIPSSAPYYAAKQRRGRPLPRTPAPGCKNCQILFTELQVVKQLLECELESNHELKQIHSSTKRANVKYSRRKRFSLSKAPHYVRLVEEFRVHAEGVNPSRKIRDNAKQRATHVIHFLEFMADPAIPNVDLLFLRNHGKVRELWSFLAHLQAKGFKPTTQRAYLMDAIAFMKYILNMSPPQVRLGKKRFNALLVELRARYRDVGREVVVHQLNVWRSKSNRLVQAEKHALLIEEAPQKIAAALDYLEKQPQNRSIVKLFFGLLGGYIIAITGHRKGVIINMTTEEVDMAEKTKQGGRIIRVKQHKTQRYHGQAAVPLYKNEYTWLQRYNHIREYVEGGSEAPTFFHSSSGGVLHRLPVFFKAAWEMMNLGIAPTFNMLRSSCSTYAKRQLGRKSYDRVATFMCHDAITAKRFYQAEDPAEDTLQSRALTTNAIATYAANKRKRREDRGSVQDEDSEGSEKEEQQSSGTEELLDRTLFQCSSNKMVSPGQGEGAGSAGATIRETKQDLKKGVEHLQKVTYQLRKRKMVIFYKNDRTDVGKLTQEDNPEEEEEDEAREWVPKQSVSSSDDDGTDDWKPTQDESEGYSEEEEEQERKRIPKMAAASEEDGTHDSRPTQDESKDDSKDEAEHLGQMIHKVATEKMQQAYVSQDKAMTVNKSSEKRVIHQTRCLKRLTFHQSTLFEDTIPRSDNNKKDQSGMSSAAIITSEQLEEKEIQEESLEKMKSEGKEGKRKENVQQEPLEKMSGKKKRKEEKIQAEPLEKMSGKRQRKEEKIQAEPLEKMKSEAKVGKRKEKVQQEPLEKMKSEAKVEKRKEKVQQEPLEKMKSEAKVGKRKEKVQQEPLEKMRSKRQRKEEKIQAEPQEKMKSEAKVGKRKEKVQQEPLEKMRSKRQRKEEKIQAEPLEKMKSEAKVEKRKEKVQQEPLEKMKSEAKVEKRKEKVQQEPLEKMRSKRQRKEEKIQAEPLEKMKSEAKVEKRKEKVQQEPLEKMKSEAKVEKRKEKVQQEPLEKMRSKRQRKEEKIQAEPLEKMKSEAKVEKRKEKVQQEPLEKMKSEAKVEKRKEKVQQEPLEKMRSKRQRKEEKIQADPQEKMSGKRKRKEEKIQAEPLGKRIKIMK
ncbi:uncharacterized protein LOC113013696 isoform X4 [Astatotilapia calliptera]|uniref:uncharacterized protein LOC113013696 isoform X4 n=1 Tax=Astatotilapia calliptera TaxID=8154 RepID=UPI000E4020EB|nr:uncharacterized protein LOC113013696 isoform X4 [Astatotilapia calliptera]